MIFTVFDDYSWRVAWSHDTWRFKKGQGVDLTLFVDNAGLFPIHAVAASDDTAAADLPAKEALFDLMRRGNRMTVRASGNTYAFGLDGTYAALTELLNCTDRYATVEVMPLRESTPALVPQPPPSVLQPPASTDQPRQPTGRNVDRSGKSNAIRLVLGEGTELRPQQVFEKASGAVYVVTLGKAQGSAVAVNERELLTNCHVVGRATTVTLEREGLRLSASVVSADTLSDRCVLRTGDASGPLPKWARVRPYADIKIGERVFSIGAPQGFELSLGEGIVLSKRSQDGERLLQTSAPISKGSSGGGLFDAQGNLVGITTFMIRDAQNLNFAIAAEEYAR